MRNLLATILLLSAASASAADGILFYAEAGGIKVQLSDATGTSYTLQYRVLSPVAGTTQTLSLKPAAGATVEQHIVIAGDPTLVWLHAYRGKVGGKQGERYWLEPGRPVRTLDVALAVLAAEYRDIADAALSEEGRVALRGLWAELEKARLGGVQASKQAAVEKEQNEIQKLEARKLELDKTKKGK